MAQRGPAPILDPTTASRTWIHGFTRGSDDAPDDQPLARRDHAVRDARRCRGTVSHKAAGRARAHSARARTRTVGPWPLDGHGGHLGGESARLRAIRPAATWSRD